jgi:PKD repeat protein
MTVSDGNDITVYRMYVIVDNLPPSIVASADRDHILEGEAVNFTAVVTDRSPLDTFTVLWDFDDGTTSNVSSLTHTFVQEGNYIVVLTVEDDDGGTNTTTFLVAVANVRPTVRATASALTIDEGASVTFDVQWTDPGVLDTFRLMWDFGDGSNSTQATVTHVFPENGTYTVVVSVTDDAGGAGSTFFVIDVLNVAPSVQVTVSQTEIDEGGTVVLTAVGSDPGVLDELTYRWDLGDGSPPVYESSFPHTYLDNGAYRVVLVVEDDDGVKNTSSRTIIVRNVPPTLVASADRTSTTVWAQVSFNASATDVTVLDEISYSWNFGDGTTSTLATTSHVYQVTGTYEVTLIVRDDDGGQAVWNTTITVLPDLDGDGIPDAEDDDRDGDGVKNSDDPYPDDPTRTKSWSSTYLMLLLIVVVLVAVVAYMVTRPRRR